MSNPLNQEEQFNRAVAQLERGQDIDSTLSVLDESSQSQVKPWLEIVVAAQKLPSFSMPAERSKVLAAALTAKLASTQPVIGPVEDASLIAPISLEAHRLRRNSWGPKLASALAAVALLFLVFGGLFWLAQQAPEQTGATPSSVATTNPLVPTVSLTETSNPTTVNTWGNKTPDNATETAQTMVKAAYNTYTPKPATTDSYMPRYTPTPGSTTTANSTTEASTVGNSTTIVNTTVLTSTQAATPTSESRSTTGVTTTLAPTNTTPARTANTTTLAQSTPPPVETIDTPEATKTQEPSKTPKTPSPTPAPTTDNHGKGGGSDGNGNGGGGNNTPSPTKTNGGGHSNN